MIDKNLINVLACPKCKKGVKLSDDGEYLICENCDVAYPISENIPVMLTDAAKPLHETEKKN